METFIWCNTNFNFRFLIFHRDGKHVFKEELGKKPFNQVHPRHKKHQNKVRRKCDAVLTQRGQLLDLKEFLKKKI